MPTPEELSRAMNGGGAAAPAAGGLDFHAILASLMQQQQQQPNMAILAQILNAPRGHHYGIGGGEIAADNPLGNAGGDPFTNGFFSRAPGPDPNFMLRGSNPMEVKGAQIAGLLPNIPEPMKPTMQNTLPYGEGMINPRAPDATKYTDTNFWSAAPNINPNGWFPGASVRDELSQYGTPQIGPQVQILQKSMSPDLKPLVSKKPIAKRRPVFSF